jgi:transporter family-2 protein
VIAGLARGGFGTIVEARHLGPQYLIGGALGACYVSTVLVTVRTLGAGGIVAATIAGQLTMSVIIDQFGLLGLDKDPISAMKAVGVVLLAAGTLLVVRG